MRAQEGVIKVLAAAGSSAEFDLLGGDYLLSGNATWSTGNANLEVLAADKATWILCTHLGTVTLNSSNTTKAASLGAGTYRWTLAGAATDATLAVSRFAKE